jgi:RNA polymerase sigma-70 factor (ECF subfamily)
MNDDELEAVYDAHASGLFHYLVTITKTETDARDLLQELFIRLARRLSGLARFSPKSPVLDHGNNPKSE